MENLRSLEPQAKISHSYKEKECINTQKWVLKQAILSKIVKNMCLSTILLPEFS